MQSLLQNKKLVISGAVVLVLAAGYFFFFSGSSDEPLDEGAIEEVAANPSDLILGRDLLSALSKMKSTKLDGSFFSDPVFLSLTDSSVQVNRESVGRKNPFAPFSGMVTEETKKK